jgi:hypothetical protein
MRTTTAPGTKERGPKNDRNVRERRLLGKLIENPLAAIDQFSERLGKS